MSFDISAPAQLPQILDQLTDSYSLDRRDGTSDTEYGHGTDYTQDAATADIYLYQPSSSHEIVTTGEQFQGVLAGICLPAEDVQVHDRLSWGDGRYEIQAPIEKQPTPQDTEFLSLTLDRVAQPDPDLV